ncbi:potassium channel family protein [Bacillus carboniphilus]|uniref:Potassium channel family protein n=1 Tax=Bacillus carboniphilus TaxID=86663 RepID=A0ABY9JWM1_9BACI|nr:potassium channel family protein [Bacillus carboniphilus]WLR42693.1 potassium channel family protein [Bacillus carboniphilus]
MFWKASNEYQMLSVQMIGIFMNIYLSLVLFFGIVYAILNENGFPILMEQGLLLKGDFVERLKTAIYFSAVTLFSVGYGDITPVGIGRLLAVVQALIGYLLPTIFRI